MNWHSRATREEIGISSWKLHVGIIGQFFDWITRGWWARTILKRPDPRRVVIGQSEDPDDGTCDEDAYVMETEGEKIVRKMKEYQESLKSMTLDEQKDEVRKFLRKECRNFAPLRQDHLWPALYRAVAEMVVAGEVREVSCYELVPAVEDDERL